jgi:hypothetical protein
LTKNMQASNLGCFILEIPLYPFAITIWSFALSLVKIQFSFIWSLFVCTQSITWIGHLVDHSWSILQYYLELSMSFINICTRDHTLACFVWCESYKFILIQVTIISHEYLS